MEYVLIAFIAAAILCASIRIGRDAGSLFICAIFFAYSIILPVARPALFLTNDIYFPLISHDEISRGLRLYLYAGLLFYVVFLFSYIFARKLPFRQLGRRLSLDEILVGRTSMIPNALLALLLVVSFLINASQLGSWIYVVDVKTERSAFELMQASVDGSWYVTILKGAAIYPTLLAIGRQIALFRVRAIGIYRCLVAIAVYLALYYVIVRPPTRTELIGAVLACTVALLHRGKPIRQVIGGAVGLISGVALMHFVNFLRTGAEYQPIDSWRDLLNASLLNFHQMETAIKLMLSFPHPIHWYEFKYLAGAITPIAIIPSALLPVRPAANKDAILTSDLWSIGGNHEFFSENSTVTFGIYASGYADYGFLGVCLAASLFALVVRFILTLYCESRVARVYFIAALITVIGGSRYSVEGVLLGLWTFLLFTIVLLVLGRFGRRVEAGLLSGIVQRRPQ